MRFLFAACLFLSACGSIVPRPDASLCVACVQKTFQDPFGLLTVNAPDSTGFARLPPQPVRVYVECKHEVIDEIANKEPERNSKDCHKLVTELMTQKKFVLMPETGPRIQKWVFRFEETRQYDEAPGLAESFLPAPASKMWCTLTRFSETGPQPFSHILKTASATYERSKFRANPPDQLHIAPQGRDTLATLLTQALIENAVKDATAGADSLQ